MKLKTIKTETEALSAIQNQQGGRPLVEITSRDNSIRSVRIGGLHLSSDYGMTVAREVPHEIEDRYRVTAEVKGFAPRIEYFDSYSEASEFKRSFDDNVEAKLDENVKVLVDASGKIVGEAGDQPKADGGDLPF